MVIGKINEKILVLDRYGSFELADSTGIFPPSFREEVLFSRILYQNYVPSFRLQPLPCAT